MCVCMYVCVCMWVYMCACVHVGVQCVYVCVCMVRKINKNAQVTETEYNHSPHRAMLHLESVMETTARLGRHSDRQQ